jgi:hypothetical protein
MSGSLHPNGATAAAHDFTVLLNHPVGRARLAVNLEQFVQIRVGNGVAFIGGQAVFSGTLRITRAIAALSSAEIRRSVAATEVMALIANS